MTADSSTAVGSIPTRWPALMIDRGLRLAGSVSIRTKILGIVLALTSVLGLGITWQVRTAMQGILRATRSVDPIFLDDLFGLHTLLTDTVANHPDATYAFILDTDGQVLAHTFGPGGIPVSAWNLLYPHPFLDPLPSLLSGPRPRAGFAIAVPAPGR